MAIPATLFILTATCNKEQIIVVLYLLLYNVVMNTYNIDPDDRRYHYYGDVVRTLFIISGLLMIVSYPFFRSFISAPVSLSIVGFVAFAILAGLTSPKQKWIIVLNTITSIIAFVVFEYAAVYTYINLTPAKDVHVAFFWVNQVLSLIFFFTSYLSTKTFRATFLDKGE